MPLPASNEPIDRSYNAILLNDDRDDTADFWKQRVTAKRGDGHFPHFDLTAAAD
jgi:hypothetical protein